MNIHTNESGTWEHLSNLSDTRRIFCSAVRTQNCEKTAFEIVSLFFTSSFSRRPELGFDPQIGLTYSDRVTDKKKVLSFLKKKQKMKMKMKISNYKKKFFYENKKF